MVGQSLAFNASLYIQILRLDLSESETYIALHGDELEAAVMTLVVQLRLPAVAHVEKLVAGRRLCIACLFVGLRLLKGGAARYDVDVRRYLARGDNGVAALNGQRRAADGKQLGLCRAKDGSAN